MTGIINTFPPITELPPGSASGPANLPPVTYQYAVTGLPQTWTGVQTFAFGTFQLAGSTSGVTALQPQGVATGILSLPNGPDTLVGRASTDTLTNKTINGNNNTLTVLTNQLSGGVWRNIRLAKTALYTVANADNGKTIALAGAAFYALTFSAASGYDADFSIGVLNEDSGRAKWISISSGTSFYLWPGQSILVYNSNNAWQVIGRRRWKLPSGALTINTDFTNGSDTNGVSDGLGTGATAFKTFQYALNVIVNNEFDWDSTLSPTLITIKGAAGVTDTTTIHWSPHGGAPLAQGSAAITIDGNGGTLNCTPSCVELFYGAVVTLKNVTLIGASNGISLFRGSKLYIGPTVTFGACGNSKIYLAEGATLDIQNSFSWTGNSTNLIENAGGVIRVPSAVTATLLASVTLTTTVYGTSNGLSDLANITWALGGFTVTAGNAYNISQFHTLTGYATIPGSGAGSVSTLIGDVAITAGNSVTLNTVSVAKGGTGDTGTAWTTYTPSIAAGTNSFTTASATGRYKQLGKTVIFQATLTITTNGTAASNVQIGIPTTAGSGKYPVVGYEAGLTGKQLAGIINASASSAVVTLYDGTYPGGTGAMPVINGVYEAA